MARHCVGCGEHWRVEGIHEALCECGEQMAGHCVHVGCGEHWRVEGWERGIVKVFFADKGRGDREKA